MTQDHTAGTCPWGDSGSPGCEFVSAGSSSLIFLVPRGGDASAGGHTLGPSSGRRPGSCHLTTVEMSSRLHSSRPGGKTSLLGVLQDRGLPRVTQVPGGAEFNGMPGGQSMLTALNKVFGCAAHHVGSSFSDQGSNLRPPHWKRRVLITGPPGKFLPLPTSPPTPQKQGSFSFSPAPSRKLLPIPAAGRG